MSGATKIEWTSRTWNPVTGCTKVSAGCKHCYAETFAKRTFRQLYGDRDFTEVRCHPERLEQPLSWRKPQKVFVNSMSDLFHEDVPTDFQDRVFAVMALAKEHTFQILTKRPQEMRRYLDSKDPACLAAAAPEQYPCSSLVIEDCDWPLPNVWLGVSVENQETADERIPVLLQTPAAVRFLSVEPLLGSVNLTAHLDRGADYYGQREWKTVDWVIVGGESGPGARPCNIEWIRDIVRQCKAAGVACFVKQVGAVPVMLETEWRALSTTPLLSATNHLKVLPGFVPLHLRDRKGGDINEFPEDLRVREWPEDLRVREMPA